MVVAPAHVEGPLSAARNRRLPCSKIAAQHSLCLCQGTPFSSPSTPPPPLFHFLTLLNPQERNTPSYFWEVCVELDRGDPTELWSSLVFHPPFHTHPHQRADGRSSSSSSFPSTLVDWWLLRYAALYASHNNFVI